MQRIRAPRRQPLATEMEFRLTHPFPKHCANFGNERIDERLVVEFRPSNCSVARVPLPV